MSMSMGFGSTKSVGGLTALFGLLFMLLPFVMSGVSATLAAASLMLGFVTLVGGLMVYMNNRVGYTLAIVGSVGELAASFMFYNLIMLILALILFFILIYESKSFRSIVKPTPAHYIAPASKVHEKYVE